MNLQFCFKVFCYQLPKNLMKLKLLTIFYLQWLLDCLACLLKLICQFAVDPSDLDLAYHDVFAWSGVAENHRKRTWPGKSRKTAGDHTKGLHIPRLTEVKNFSLKATKMKTLEKILSGRCDTVNVGLHRDLIGKLIVRRKKCQ